MNKIRVENKNLYIIEVNDNGDTISFDYTNPAFPLKLLDCYDKLVFLASEYGKKQKELSEKEEDILINEFATKKQKELFELNLKYYNDARNALDLFLGENACEKIFGDSNWPDMFEELFEKLTPEFEKMNVNFEHMQTKIANKYKNKTKKVI